MNDNASMYDFLKAILTVEELRGLTGISVIEDNNGYVLFNEYQIKKDKNHYVLTHFDTYLNRKFFSVRNALIYATLDKRNRVSQANRVYDLDKMLEGAISNTELHQHLASKAKTVDAKCLYKSKLSEDKNKKREILRQLNDYATEVKNWQFRQFAEVKK